MKTERLIWHQFLDKSDELQLFWININFILLRVVVSLLDRRIFVFITHLDCVHDAWVEHSLSLDVEYIIEAGIYRVRMQDLV